MPTPPAIAVSPSSDVSILSRKHSEHPNHFLICVQKYAETVHGWDRPPLLKGISQPLQNIALEWYCQLRISHRQPSIWIKLANLTRSQFNSPIRSARQEQEWYECKQRKNETNNEFLVRSRVYGQNTNQWKQKLV